jgi:hypothetical protein
MKNSRKFILYSICIIIICAIQTTISFAETKFQLLQSDGDRRIDCDYIEIKNNNIVCKDNKFIITYKIDKIKELKLIKNSNAFSVKQFTIENITKINQANSNKIENKRSKSSHENHNDSEQSTLSSLSKFKNYLKTKYSHFSANNTLSMIIQVLGLIIFFVGSIKYIVETFRISILWGLSCMFLPFVSFIFLIVHWKVASKPFFLSLFGIGIMLLCTLFTAQASSNTYNAKSHLNFNKNYKCSGKIYCSEMTSCAEAKFYLRNCQDTKIDGNNDGVPCEKQWCN